MKNLMTDFHFVGLPLARAQLYEQILAENEKLKAQLRDTDLELADLKLQLEKATQVGARRRVSSDTVASAVSPLTSLFPLCPLPRVSRAEAGALRRPIPAGDGEKGN